jgi:hypothetical protein
MTSTHNGMPILFACFVGMTLSSGVVARAPRGSVGGSSNQITLQPVSVEGGVGLNAAPGVAPVSLRKLP